MLVHDRRFGYLPRESECVQLGWAHFPTAIQIPIPSPLMPDEVAMINAQIANVNRLG